MEHQKNDFVAVGHCWRCKLSFPPPVAATTIAAPQAVQHPPGRGPRRDTPPGSNLHGTAGQDQHMADTAATRFYSHAPLTLDKIDDYFGHFSKRQTRPCPIFADFRESASKMRPQKISAPAAGDAVATSWNMHNRIEKRGIDSVCAPLSIPEVSAPTDTTGPGKRGSGGHASEFPKSD